MKKRHLYLFLACLGSALTLHAGGNDTLVRKQKDCRPKEIGEILFKKSVRTSDTSRAFHFFLLPYVAYSPTKGFQIGVGGTLSWYTGKSRITYQSAASATVEFTTEDQKLLQLKSNVYTDENKWFLQGDWRFYFYSLPTYGLGSGYNNPIPPLSGTKEDTLLTPASWNQSFHVKYNWLKVHEIFSHKIIDHLYAGLGYHLDLHYDIRDFDLESDTITPVLTPHSAYSYLHGFNPERYVASGISLNFVYDTRDNLINPYKGYFVHVNLRRNLTWLGSSKEATQLWTEFRTYIGLEKKLPRHLLAFWLYGGFQLSGEVPYFDLWATGFDQMNSSGRGYIQGRWRGENLVYGEVEYRFPISRCTQILGGVLFCNVSTASSKDQDIPLFGYLRPAGGFGLRIMLSKANRTNLLIDFTFGQPREYGIYFSAQEAF